MQSSLFNDAVAELAMDGDVNTCSLTGFQRGAWWVFDAERKINVTGVSIRGTKNGCLLQ